MSDYTLGIDVGTTYTGAAVVRDGRAEVVALGNRSSVVPTVILLRDDDEVLTGEAANRRAVTEPGRVAREFKRRMGDPTPMLLGGVPMSPQALMGRMLRWVVDRVTEAEGGPPTHVAVTHPANWGPYKLDLLDQAVRLAGMDAVTTISEPEAAAMSYASNERLAPGEIVAVYDLGGGTFDAAVLRKDALGFEIVGSPEGIEHLGGIDVDEAVFAFVTAGLGQPFDELDPDDPAAVAAVARLRRECVDAKEALSVDRETMIPVLLPGMSTEMAMTRTDLEGLIRPLLSDTIGALRRSLESAGVTATDLSAVLLVGGSSRMPLVAEMVTASLGRPVAVDAHPKHAVALGAALAADRALARQRGQVAGPVEVIEPRPTPADSMPPPVAGATTTTIVGGQLPAPTLPPPPSPPAGSRGSRRWLVTAAIVVLVAAAVTVPLLLLRDDGSAEDDASIAAAADTVPGVETTGPTMPEPSVTGALVDTESSVIPAPTTTLAPTTTESTIATSTTTTSTTTTTTTIDPRPRLEEQARQQLSNLLDSDAATVESLRGWYVPQLSAKHYGLIDEDDPESFHGWQDILADHQVRRDNYGAVLAYSNDFGIFPEFRRHPDLAPSDRAGWYLSWIPIQFSTEDAAKQWCIDNGLPDNDDCLVRDVPVYITAEVNRTCGLSGGGDCFLTRRDDPTSSSDERGRLGEGEEVIVRCEVIGEAVESSVFGASSNVWAKLVDNSYVAAIFLDAPELSPFSITYPCL